MNEQVAETAAQAAKAAKTPLSQLLAERASMQAARAVTSTAIRIEGAKQQAADPLLDDALDLVEGNQPRQSQVQRAQPDLLRSRPLAKASSNQMSIDERSKSNLSRNLIIQYLSKFRNLDPAFLSRYSFREVTTK